MKDYNGPLPEVDQSFSFQQLGRDIQRLPGQNALQQWRVVNFTLWIIINFCTRCSTPIALQQLAFLSERRQSIHQEERLPHFSCDKQTHHAMHLRNLGSHSFTLTSRPHRSHCSAVQKRSYDDWSSRLSRKLLIPTLNAWLTTETLQHHDNAPNYS